MKMNNRYSLPMNVRFMRQRQTRLVTRRSAGVIAIFALLANIVGYGMNIAGGTAGATGDHNGSPKFKVDLKQWADQAPANWQHGNLNRNNSDYQEGQSVPFQLKLSNLTSGKDYTIRVRYDLEKKEPQAYDYLTTYNFSRSPSPIPAGAPVTKAIPTDSGLPFAQMPGSFSLWGGTFVGDIAGPVTHVHEKYYDLTLKASSATMTLLWGGHLASATNWGAGLGAGSISGAPFHMAISRIVDGKETSSQDRSIHLDQSDGDNDNDDEDGDDNNPPGDDDDDPPGNDDDDPPGDNPGSGAVCAQGDVKLNTGSGYEYTDGSGTITILNSEPHNSVTWAAADGFVITSICIKIGGPGGGSLIYPNVNDVQAGPYGHDISHVVLITEPVGQPTPVTNIALNKTGPATVDAGQNISYTLAWSVTGNTAATNAVLTDPIPANTTFVSASNGGTHNAGTVTWNLGTKNPGNSGTVTLVVAVGASVIDNTVITNTGTFDTDQTGPVNDPAQTTVQNDPEPPAPVTTISLDKSGPATVAANGQITYTLAWSVSGNTAATNAMVSDPIPANTTFVSAANGGTLSSGVITWNFGTKAVGSNGVVAVTVSVNSGLASGTVIVNNGSFDTDQTGPANDSVNTTIQVTTPVVTQSVQPTISIVKSNNLTTFISPGSQVTYTVVVTNSASATLSAQNVVLTDVLPTGFTYVVSGGSTKNFTLGNIAPGASVTTTYVAAISASHAAGIFVNTATAKGDNTNTVSAVSAVEVRVPQVLSATAAPQLVVKKSAGTSVVNPGGNVTYTITIKNTGNAPALDVVLTDTLPAGFTFHTGGGNVKQWELGTIAEGQTKTIKYKTDVSADATLGVAKNTAVVTSSNAGSSVVQAPVSLARTGRVLGLATTGAGLKDYIIFAFGLILVASGPLLFRRLRQQKEVLYSNQQ